MLITTPRCNGNLLFPGVLRRYSFRCLPPVTAGTLTTLYLFIPVVSLCLRDAGDDPYLRASSLFLFRSRRPSPVQNSPACGAPKNRRVLALHYTRAGIYATAVGPVIPRNHKVRYLDRLSTAVPLRASDPRLYALLLRSRRPFLPLSISSSPSLGLSFWTMKSRRRSEIEILLDEWPAENGRRGFIR